MAKKYVILYDEMLDQYFMDGVAEDLIGTHLVVLIEKHAIRETAWSESHAIAILAEHNISVEIITGSGQPLEW